MPKATKSAPKKKPATGALADLGQRITRYFELNTKRKEIEREEDELKAFFKGEAGGKPMDFEHQGVVVSVTQEGRSSLDLVELRKVVTQEVLANCTKDTSFEKVTVRKVASEGAA